MIHLLTAIGLTHGGSSTVHIYTQTEHRTTQFTKTTQFPKTTQFTMWKNIVEPTRPQMTILSMRIGCWIPKATNTHS